MEGDKAEKRKFKADPIGYFHIGIAEVRTEEGKLHLYVAIDRTSKFAFAQLRDKADQPTAVSFLKAPIEAIPYQLHTILTDNAIQFADLPHNRNSWTARDRVHRFDHVRREHDIERRLTKPNHPWTNGQVERMNRTIKDATVKRYHYDSRDQLQQHLQLFIDAYNHGRRLKTLPGLTPFEDIARIWTEEPPRFKIDPYHHTPGPNN
jgi:transposase